MQGVGRARVYPTEDREKVEQALRNLLGECSCKPVQYEGYLELETSFNGTKSLEWLRQRIQDIRIIDASRTRLQSNWDGTGTRLCVDKQAAFLGRLRVIDDSEELPSLGYIEVSVEFENPAEFSRFLTWITPRTESGRIVPSHGSS
jgi:predicted RNA binding protein with dsRBD fold (UPF0201 family)